MNDLLRHIYVSLFWFFYDILVYSPTLEDHLTHLHVVLELLEQHRCGCTISPRHGWPSNDNGPIDSYPPHLQGIKTFLIHYSRPRSHPVLHSTPPSTKFVLHSLRHPVFSQSDLSPTNQQSSRKNPQGISCLPHHRSFRGETHALQICCILLLARMDPWCKEIYPAMPYLPKQQVPAQQTTWVNITSPNLESSLGRFIYGFHNPLTFIGRPHHHLGHLWPFDQIRPFHSFTHTLHCPEPRTTFFCWDLLSSWHAKDHHFRSGSNLCQHLLESPIQSTRHHTLV